MVLRRSKYPYSISFLGSADCLPLMGFFCPWRGDGCGLVPGAALDGFQSPMKGLIIGYKQLLVGDYSALRCFTVGIQISIYIP